MIAKRWGHSLDKPLQGLAKRLNINPNILTITGFLITAIAGITITINLRLGGVLILIAGLFDMLDGVFARINERVTDFGAFLDSVLDRYSDAFLFLGIAYYLRENLTGIILSLGTLIGAFLVSYTRARAEGLGKDCKVGIMGRPERLILLIFGTLTGWIIPVLWLMFFLTHITVLQRIWHLSKAISD